MGKTLFVLELEEVKQRKACAPPVKRHKNKKAYSRKEKYKGRREQAASGFAGGFLFAVMKMRYLSIVKYSCNKNGLH